MHAQSTTGCPCLKHHIQPPCSELHSNRQPAVRCTDSSLVAAWAYQAAASFTSPGTVFCGGQLLQLQ